MERLIKDANKLRNAQGKAANLTIDSYADVIEAIHTVQDEMGITGTTAKEAEGTIQGSLQMTKAAWKNMLIALSGGNINLKKSINDLVNSAITTFKNIMPVIMNVLDGFGEVVQQVAPVIAENLPKLVQDVLPKLLDAATQLVMGLIRALPGIFAALQTSINTILVDIVGFLNGNGLTWLGDFVTAAMGLFNGLISLFNGDLDGAIDSFAITFGKIIQGILEMFGMSASDAKDIMFKIVGWIGGAVDSIVKFWDETLYPAFAAIWKYVTETLAPALQKAWDEVIKPAVVGTFETIASFWNDTLYPVLVAIWTYITETLAPALQKAWEEVIQPAIVGTFEAITNFWNETLKPVFEAIKGWLEEKLGPAFDVVTGAIKGDKKSMDKLKDAFIKFLPVLTGAIGAFISYKAAVTIGKIIDIVTHSTGLLSAAQAVLNAVMNANPFVLIATLLGGLATALITAYNTNEDFRKKVDAAWRTIKNLAKTVWGGIVDWFNSLGDTVKDVWDKYLKPVANWFSKTFTPVIDGVKDAFDGIVTFLTYVFTGNWESAWNTIVDGFGTIFGGIGDLMKEPINAVVDALNWLIDKVEGAINKIVNGINNHIRIKLDPIDVPLIGRVWDGFDWHPRLKTVSWSRIEKLATGGFLGNGQRAIVGEYRPEMLSVINGKALVQPIGGVHKGDRLGGGNTYNNSVNVYQQPGESIEELAKRIERVFTRWQQQENAVWA